MAFLKQTVVYTVCALAFVYYQCEVASAINCLSCNSTSTADASKCDSSNITDTAKYQNCSTASTCYEVLYKENGTDYVQRGCDLNCDSTELVNNLTSKDAWSCFSCNREFCNAQNISYNSSATISRITFGSLLLSAAVTLYLY